MKSVKRFKGILLSGATGLSILFLSLGHAAAAQLTNSSLTLGSGLPSAVTSYTFQASGFTATAVQCIAFRFNTASDMSGAVPTGFSSTSATLSSSSTLITSSSWTVGAANNGTVDLTDTAGATPASSGNIILSNITNGSTSDTAYFVQVTTYTSSACTGNVDNVTVGLIYTAGQAVSVTVNPLLSFSVAGLISGASVNGASTNFATTATTIPFGTTPSVSTNAIGAQALTISTNSGNGYSIAVDYSGPLTNGTHSIANFSGTNAAPASFTAAGTENFGYTTNSAALSRFATNLWAGLNTTGGTIASSTVPVNNATTDIGYQVGLSSSTPPGSYATTVVYTATALY